MPKLHENDALRAVRAVDEMREVLVRLNAEIERELGMSPFMRVPALSREKSLPATHLRVSGFVIGDTGQHRGEDGSLRRAW